MIFSKNLIIRLKYDFILIIIDRLTKYGYIILFCEDWGIDVLVHLFLRNIVNIYNILNEIISDRDI